jgi:ribosomal protein S27E
MRRTRTEIVYDRTREWKSFAHSGYAGYMKCSVCGEVTRCHGRSRRKVKCLKCYVGST